MLPGGGLVQLDHFDVGSLVTVDVMLEEGGKGGDFQTVEVGGKSGLHIQEYDFRVGDALVFVSHKLHRVSRLVEGRRRVLVVEVWGGEERFCGHRCDVREGVCRFQ